MCAVSHMGDYYGNKWHDWVLPPDPYRVYPEPDKPRKVKIPVTVNSNISREEFEALKRQVEEMMEVMRQAKLYDEKTGQPECEHEEKMAKIRQICEIFNVDFDKMMDTKGE